MLLYGVTHVREYSILQPSPNQPTPLPPKKNLASLIIDLPLCLVLDIDFESISF